jgi:hypothetical protein
MELFLPGVVAVELVSTDIGVTVSVLYCFMFKPLFLPKCMPCTIATHAYSLTSDLV